MKIIQILSDDEDSLTALTDDGRIFYGYWKAGKFTWQGEITPDERGLQELQLKVAYQRDFN